MSREKPSQRRRRLMKGVGTGGAALFAGFTGVRQQSTVKFVHPGYFSADMKDLHPMFEEAYSNVELKTQKTPAESSSTRKYYVNQFISRSSSFDTGMMDVIWPAEFAKNGWAKPVDDSVIDTDKMLSTPVEAVTIDGKLYGAPLFTDANALYYRTDLLEEHGFDGPPKTEMELVNMAKEIKKQSDQDLNGYIWQGGPNEGLTIMWLNWLWGRGGTVHHDGKLKVNTPKGVAALEHAVSLIHEHGVTPDSIPASSTDQNRKTFQQGNTIFMRNWPYAYALMNQDGSAVKDKFAVASMPDAEGNVGAKNSCLGGWNVFVNSYSKNQAAAEKFMKFMTSMEAQKNMALQHSRLPVRKELYADKYKQQSQALDVFSQIVEETRARPATPQYSTFSEIVFTECNKALVESKSPEKALNDAQKQIDQEVNNA